MNAWLFDVDGVLTNPAEKRIVESQIFDEIIARLKRNEPIGLNTGRSIDFVIEQVLNPLEARIEDKKLLDGIIAIGEKGGVYITYEDGKRIEHIDEQIKVPNDLEIAVRKLTKSDFSETMFFDETKKTMISVEMKHGEDLEKFHLTQQKLVEKLKLLLKEMDIQNLKIDPTTIATDIENSHVGKALGTNRFLKILEERGISPQSITAFGDSSSDFEMLEPLRQSGVPTKFVFVGNKGFREESEVQTTNNHFDQGTLEYLRKN
jgi:HAD superfamily hydrolase (TIGR01484 family)